MTDKAPKNLAQSEHYDFMKVFSFCKVIQSGSTSFTRAAFEGNAPSYLAAFVEEKLKQKGYKEERK